MTWLDLLQIRVGQLVGDEFGLATVGTRRARLVVARQSDNRFEMARGIFDRSCVISTDILLFLFLLLLLLMLWLFICSISIELGFILSVCCVEVTIRVASRVRVDLIFSQRALDL